MLRSRPSLAAYGALTAVCVAWGTVYLGIRIALESFPPTLLMGVRFLAAGIIVLAISRLLGARMPSRGEWIRTSCFGIITLGIGVGTLFYAIQWIPSGLAAMLTTTSPFWMVAIDALIDGGDRPSAPTIGGMLIGLIGALLLVVPGAIQEGLGGRLFMSFVVLQIGCAAFALGSILERRHRTHAHPIVNAAVQELATGIVFLIPALAMRESARWDVRGLAAISYLIVVGGVIGYSAFLYSMKHLPVSLVSIYTYVNPAVAVLVGFALYGERFHTIDMIAMAMICAGVVAVNHFSAKEAGQKSLSELPAIRAQNAPD
mgnify:CR=1 FL=1